MKELKKSSALNYTKAFSFHILFSSLFMKEAKKKKKAASVTGHGGPYCCEILRISHFLDNLLTDGAKITHFR
jgi:hypothetical protein